MTKTQVNKVEHTQSMEGDEVQPDVEFKTFWRESKRFADLFNGVCFAGEEVIQADQLHEADTGESGVVEYSMSRTSLQQTRDIIKKSAYGCDFTILGIENQKTVDYTMPLRVMVYDGQNYLKQLKEKKDDDSCYGNQQYQVSPVITIVIYYGKKPWDGPLWLSEMMGDLPISMRSMVSDYKMNLVQVLQDGTEHFHNDEVKMIFEYSQAFMNKDTEKLDELNQHYKVNTDVLYMIGKITDSKDLMKCINVEKDEEEEGNMCEYLEEIRNSGLKEGILGMIDIMRELQHADSVIEDKLVKKFGLSKDKAREYLEM